MMVENEISGKILKASIAVHKSLGPGLLESSYQHCLAYKLEKEGLFVEKEKPIPLIFEEIKIPCAYRVDLLVEGKVVVEIKSVEMLADIHLAQILTYLKIGGFKLGLLINFNVLLLKNGVKRVIY